MRELSLLPMAGSPRERNRVIKGCQASVVSALYCSTASPSSPPIKMMTITIPTEMLFMLQRLFITAILTASIGFERHSRGRPADIRMHVLLGLGSCLMAILSLRLYEQFAGVDVARLPGQVINGIGFLGAGVIFKNRTSIQGLTTAVGLWVVSGIGLAVGSGFILESVVTTAVTLLCLFALRPVDRFLEKSVEEPMESTKCRRVKKS